jgi:hypothetical protein
MSTQSTPEENGESEAVLSLQETPAPAEAQDEVQAHLSQLSVAACMSHE